MNPRHLLVAITGLTIGIPLVVGGVVARSSYQPVARQPAPIPPLRSLIDEGLSHYQAGRPTLALDRWRQALVLAPSDPVVHNNIGSALMGLGRSEEARIAFLRAQALDPKQALYTNNLAWASRELERRGSSRAAGLP